MAAILELDEHQQKDFTIFEAAPQVSAPCLALSDDWSGRQPLVVMFGDVGNNVYENNVNNTLSWLPAAHIVHLSWMTAHEGLFSFDVLNKICRVLFAVVVAINVTDEW